MHIIKKISGSWLPLAVAFLIGALFVGSASGHPGFPNFLHAGHSDTMAGTLTAKNFKYRAPRTFLYVVPGSAFVAALPTDVPDHDNYSGGVVLPATDTAVAPVYLPQGAVVTRVTVWHGAGAANSWLLHLEQSDNVGDHVDMVVMNAAACAAAPCTTSTITVSPNTVNNTTRSHGIMLRNTSGGEIRAYRVVITYRTSTP